jgi:sugar/nucleoside kinase (ribokinase family)
VDKDREILLKSLQYIDCYLPNEDELLNLTGKGSIDDALKAVFENGAKTVVVKMGKSGCRIKTQAEDFVVPGFQVEPMTTVGAGDSFNAGFITQLLKGNELRECGRYANAVAAIKVSTNTLPTPDAVTAFLQFQS